MRLKHLFDKNVAWAERKTRDDPTFFQRLSEQQSPLYLWIGCSDSRIAANDVLDLDPGEVFVHRNVANMAHTSDMNLLTVLEFAVETLKVEHIIVCGHYGCGGVRRALGTERSALVDHWLQPIVMLHRKHARVFERLPDDRARIDRMCELNVLMQVRRIAATPIVEAAWDRGQLLNLHSWIYGLHDGLLRDLGPPFASLDDRDAAPNIDQCVEHPIEAWSGLRWQAAEAFAGMAEAETSCPACAAERDTTGKL